MGNKYCVHLVSGIIERDDEPEVLLVSLQINQGGDHVDINVSNPSDSKLCYLVSTSCFKSARQEAMSV